MLEYPVDLKLCFENCLTCPFLSFSLLDKLDSPSLEMLNRHKSMVTYKAGELLYREGTKIQGLNLIKSGKIKVFKTSHRGNELILSLRKSVNFLGLADLLLHTHHHSSAMALEDTEICILDKDPFLKIFKSNPLFSLRISEYLARVLESTQIHFLNLTQRHMRGRLAYALIYLNDFFGTREGDSYINLSLKRADLAALTNLTTANVIRTLASFEDELLIEVKGRDIRILDGLKIQEVCDLN